MSKFIHPKPIDKEIILDKTKIIMSKTDAKGIIEYANQYFIDICGYDEWELMAEPHSIIRHPDMPRIVFKLLWERLHKGENIHALVKNLAKDGSYYWVITNFETIYNDKGKIIAHFSRRKAPPRYAIDTIIPIYKMLVDIENKKGMDASRKFLYDFLESKKVTYDDFILQTLNVSQERLNIYFKGE